MLRLSDVPQERIHRNGIVKSSLAYDDRRSLLNAVVGTVEKLVQSTEFQGIFFILCDIVRLVLRWRKGCGVAKMDEQLSHSPKNSTCCKTESEYEESILSGRRQRRHIDAKLHS